MASHSKETAGKVEQSARLVLETVTTTYENWRSDRAIRLGAALAYYGVFAAVPLVTSAMAIAGLVFSAAEIQKFLVESLESVLVDLSEEAQEVVGALADTIDRPATTGGLTALSLVAGIFAASVLFVAIQDSFSMIWKVPVGHGLDYTLRRRGLAFGVVLLVGAGLIASLAVQAIALFVDDRLTFNADLVSWVNDVLVTLATWGVGIIALGVLFQLLIPDRLAWRNVFVTSAITGFLMVVGTWAVGFYFENWGTASLSGVFGGLMIILSWLFYLAQVLLAGAELLKTLEDNRKREPAADVTP